MKNNQSRSIQQILKPKGQHWVGDGFPVHTLFSYEAGAAISPFLLFDYAGPEDFPAYGKKRGVGEHPHRGFETVTLVYHGEVSHRDSSGAGGTIGPGDVQWMTAGSGVVHEEFHSPTFAQAGGRLEMVQLWVNLPATNKMTQPRYQAINAKDIPKLDLEGNAGTLRVIAGAYKGAQGPAKTFSPLNVCDIQLNTNSTVQLDIPCGHNAMIAVLSGELQTSSPRPLSKHDVAIFKQDGDTIELTALSSAKLVLLTGEPLNEPVVGHGPFVMNTREEIYQAMRDYRDGKLGTLNNNP